MRSWYHTLDLPSGPTPGWFDLRSLPARLPLGDLRGARALDVGTFDGFWAFELERRGADVLAVDVLDPRRWDWPAGSDDAVREAIGARKDGGAGFEEARAALGSRVERRELSVHDLDPAEVGEFDLVFVGSLLLHLRDPVGALAAVRRVCRGRLLSVEAFDPWLTALHPRTPVARLDAVGRPWWQEGNLAHLRRTVEAAGFEVLAGPRPVGLPPGAGHTARRTRPRTAWLRSHEGRRTLVSRLAGDPHAWTLARSAR